MREEITIKCTPAGPVVSVTKNGVEVKAEASRTRISEVLTPTQKFKDALAAAKSVEELKAALELLI